MNSVGRINSLKVNTRTQSGLNWTWKHQQPLFESNNQPMVSFHQKGSSKNQQTILSEDSSSEMSNELKDIDVNSNT